MIPRRRHQNSRRAAKKRASPGHLQWVRGHVCAVWTNGKTASSLCIGGIEAHHVRENGNAGAGMKPPDLDVVSLCSYHHAEGHRIGWETFERKYRLDLSKIAEQLAARSPHLRRAEKGNR